MARQSNTLEIIKDLNTDACSIADGERFFPSQINAFVLGKEGNCRGTPRKCAAAVTVSVCCRDAERQATKDVVALVSGMENKDNGKLEVNVDDKFESVGSVRRRG